MGDVIGQKERLQILLAEYGTLRAELIQRGAWMMQMVTVAGAATVVIFGYIFTGSIVQGVGLLCLAALLLTFGLSVNDRDTRDIVRHVVDLERRINALGGDDKLLTWETKHGLLAISLGERWRRTLIGNP